MTYLNEVGYDFGDDDDDLTSYKEAMENTQALLWYAAMQEGLNLMEKNGVWGLVEGCNDTKPVKNKWVFKTKRDSNCNIKKHKARLIAKGVTQKEGLDYTETFSPLSTNDYFRIIIVLVAYFDLQLHQMDIKNAF